MKPHPTKLHVIDDLDPRFTFNGDDPVYNQALKAVHTLRPVARRFIFDDEAATYIGHFIRDCPDLLVANRQFALPPYETTYLQFNLDVVLEAIGHPKLSGDEDRDIDVGYLVHRDRVYSLARGLRGGGGISMFSYRMGTSSKWCSGCLRFHDPIFDLSVHEGDLGDTYIRAGLLLGSTWSKLTDDEWHGFCQSVEVVPTVQRTYPAVVGKSDAEKREKYKRLIACSAGDYRTFVTALLLLNQQQHVTLQHVPHGSGIVAGKRRVFHRHQTVRIHLRQHDTVRKVFARTMHVPRRAHDVRAFFRHLSLGAECIHDWPQLPEVTDDGIPRWTCTKCGGRRVRVKAHMRGTAKEGIVTKRYEVTE